MIKDSTIKLNLWSRSIFVIVDYLLIMITRLILMYFNVFGEYNMIITVLGYIQFVFLILTIESIVYMVKTHKLDKRIYKGWVSGVYTEPFNLKTIMNFLRQKYVITTAKGNQLIVASAIPLLQGDVVLYSKCGSERVIVKQSKEVERKIRTNANLNDRQNNGEAPVNT